MTTIAILHTTPATLDPLKALAAEILPGYQVINLLDDSILPQLARNNGNLSEVEPRLVQYTACAQQAGAEALLFACSSVGEVAARARQAVSIPVVRIDEAMAEEAVTRGARLGVAATLATTLNPTTRLLQQKAAAAGRQVEVIPRLVSAAYERLLAGDKDGHDEVLAEALVQLAGEVEAVVLAQASMARVLPRLPEDLRGKFLTSPRLGIQRLAEEVARTHA